MKNHSLAAWSAAALVTLGLAACTSAPAAPETSAPASSASAAPSSDRYDLTDFPLPSMVDHFMESGKVAAFLCVQPTHSFHVVALGEGHQVTSIQHLSRSGLYVNGGYFIFRKEIFNYMRPGEELVEEPFHRLIEKGLLAAYRHDGFWLPMDTFKDKQLLEDMYSRGAAPWEVWKTPGASDALHPPTLPLARGSRAHGEPVV